MLWSDERIAKAADEAEGSAAYAVDLALREMRDEYERTIGTMREDYVRAAVDYEARIAELEVELKAKDAYIDDLEKDSDTKWFPDGMTEEEYKKLMTN